jgi:hypothetical protein
VFSCTRPVPEGTVTLRPEWVNLYSPEDSKVLEDQEPRPDEPLNPQSRDLVAGLEAHVIDMHLGVSDHGPEAHSGVKLEPTAWEPLRARQQRIPEQGIQREVVDAVGDCESLHHRVHRHGAGYRRRIARSSEGSNLRGVGGNLEMEELDPEPKPGVTLEEVSRP